MYTKIIQICKKYTELYKYKIVTELYKNYTKYKTYANNI